MLIVKINANANGTLANQRTGFDLPEIPEGWAVVPPELEQRALELLPWVTLELEDGVIVGVSDNAEARAAAAAEPTPEPAPTPEEQNTRLRAQIAMLQEQQSFLEDCLLEMAEEVYA